MHEPEPAAEGAPAWIVTFADLMSLLLTFFVLLLSFSNTEVVKFREAMGSIKDAMGVTSQDGDSKVPVGKSPLTDEIAEIGSSPSSAELEQQLQGVLESFGLESKGETQLTADGVTLRLQGDLMFNSGESGLTPRTYDLLEGLASYIASIDRRVDIVGHTDSVPISTPIYPSNWELSAGRAAEAVRYLVEHGVPPERLRAIGQADTVPIDTNDTPEGRARNRRIEFVFSAKTSRPEKKVNLEDLAGVAAKD